MSSSAEFDATMNETTISPDGRTYTAAEVDAMLEERRKIRRAELMALTNEKPEYATFRVADEPAPPSRIIAFVRRNWVRIAGYGIGLILFVTMIITIERSDTDTNVWPWQASTSGLVNQPVQINFELRPTDDHATQEQTPTIPDPQSSMEQQTPVITDPNRSTPTIEAPQSNADAKKAPIDFIFPFLANAARALDEGLR